MRRFAVIAVTVLGLSSSAAAQGQNPIELGLDGAISYKLDSPHVTGVNIPVGVLRVGIFVTPTISIEPFGSLDRTSADNNDFTSLNLGAGVLFHLSGRNTVQPYVRPFAELLHNSIGFSNNSDSDNLFALGAGLGVKIPVANRFAWRLEGALTQVLENDNNDASTVLSARFGFSFFTH
jgi:opacity protein-like surface antigen